MMIFDWVRICDRIGHARDVTRPACDRALPTPSCCCCCQCRRRRKCRKKKKAKEQGRQTTRNDDDPNAVGNRHYTSKQTGITSISLDGY